MIRGNEKLEFFIQTSLKVETSATSVAETESTKNIFNGSYFKTNHMLHLSCHRLSAISKTNDCEREAFY